MTINTDIANTLDSATSYADGVSRFRARAIATGWLLILIMLTSCATPVVELCRHRVLSQEAACIEAYGKENVETWRLTNEVPHPYRYHAQVRVRPNGKGTPWMWLPNTSITEYLSDAPQKGCVPLHKMK